MIFNFIAYLLSYSFSSVFKFLSRLFPYFISDSSGVAWRCPSSDAGWEEGEEEEITFKATLFPLLIFLEEYLYFRSPCHSWYLLLHLLSLFYSFLPYIFYFIHHTYWVPISLRLFSSLFSSDISFYFFSFTLLFF